MVFPTDYRGQGTETAIKKASSLLTTEGKFRRLAHGIYYKPKVDPVLGELRTKAEEVANLIAEKEKVRIRPTGAHALHRLGLTTQIPTKLVYLTDGSRKQIQIGKMTVELKPTTHKKLAMEGEISSLVLLALEELDLQHTGPSLDHKIRYLLDKEESKTLKHDLALAPALINDYVVKLFKPKQQNDRSG